MFCVGDRVSHPMHGAGIIDAIVEEEISGCRQEYYVFRLPADGLLLKVPTAGSGAVGLRSIVKKEDAERVIEAIPTLDCGGSANWSKRYRENMLRLKSGDLYEVARVIKSLTSRSLKRALSTGDRKMLHNARRILISEIVLTEDADYANIERRVDRAICTGLTVR